MNAKVVKAALMIEGGQEIEYDDEYETRLLAEWAQAPDQRESYSTIEGGNGYTPDGSHEANEGRHVTYSDMRLWLSRLEEINKNESAYEYYKARASFGRPAMITGPRVFSVHSLPMEF